MNNKTLFVFVEGDDDVRFFEKIVSPIILNNYSTVRLHRYAQRRKKWVKNFIDSINGMGADYLYLRDINDSPCISEKKGKINANNKALEINKMIIVVMEIESWYSAGLEEDTKLVNTYKLHTDNLDKESFNKMIPKRFDSRIDYMIEILKEYSVEIARKRNGSFNYFMERPELG